MKLSFEYRAEQASDDFLGDPASNRGNAERSKFSPSFGDENPFERSWLVRPGFEVSHEGIKVLFKVILEHLY